MLQVGGGFRSAEQVEAALASGVQRVLIGTLAAREPGVVDDARGRARPAHLRVRRRARRHACAWRAGARTRASRRAAFVERFTARGVGAFLVTAIERDGTLAGPDLRLLAAVRAVTDGVLLAAGGFAALEHIAAAREAGCDGAVVGRALYDGSLNLREALTVARTGRRHQKRCCQQGLRG